MNGLKVNWKQKDKNKANDEYLKLAEMTLKKLEENTEWVKRYEGYKQKILKRYIYSNKDWILKNDYIEIEPIFNKKQLKTDELDLKEFTSLTEFADGKSSIRCNGTKLVTITRINKDRIRLKINNKLKSIDLSQLKLDAEIMLNDKKRIEYNAKRIVDFVNKNKEYFNNKGERKAESDLIDRFKDKMGIQNFGIQPICIFPKIDMPYQFPTPFKASSVKGDVRKLDYSGPRGGGIDILARINDENHKGRNNVIAVLELKDKQTKYELKSESPDKAIKQAIVYTTFLASLINNDRINEKKGELKGFWFKTFGKNEDVYRQKYTYFAIIVIPYNKENEKEQIEQIKKFQNMIIPFDNGDEIELHYILYNLNEKDSKKVIKSSSLKKD